MTLQQNSASSARGPEAESCCYVQY